ncbi:MAG TPA: rod-binding protein [Nitrospiraceae bacterium]|nr:rod-binding protein [Nitrospiraceae bacterium]
MKPLPLYSPMAGLPDQKAQSAENMVRTLSNQAQNKSDPAEMRKAVKEFEGYFIAYLLKEMRNTVHPGLVQNKEGQQFYSFYDQEIGRLAAQSGGLGLGRMLEQALARGSQPSPHVGNSDSTQVSAPFRR